MTIDWDKELDGMQRGKANQRLVDALAKVHSAMKSPTTQAGRNFAPSIQRLRQIARQCLDRYLDKGDRW